MRSCQNVTREIPTTLIDGLVVEFFAERLGIKLEASS